MDGLVLLLRGLVLGFSVAAPVGVIGVLVIRRTISDGRLTGLVSGLGAATADAIYGSIAGFGLTFISSKLIAAGTWIRLGGGLFLVYLGFRAFFKEAVSTRSDESPGASRSSGMARAFGSTLLLTLSNPVPIVAFLGIMAGAGIGEAVGNYWLAVTLVSGIFIGSMIWWLILSTAVGYLRRWVVRPGTMLWINRASGIMIAGFGILTLGRVIAERW